MQLHTRILEQRDLERNLKLCRKQCRFYRLSKTQMHETPLGSWSFPMLLVTRILQNVQTLSTKSETRAIRGVCAPLCGLRKRARHATWLLFFCLGGSALAADSPTHDSDLDLEKQIFIWRQAALHAPYPFFSSSKCELPIYRQYVSTNGHVKYSCTACGLLEYLLTCLNHPGIAVIVWGELNLMHPHHFRLTSQLSPTTIIASINQIAHLDVTFHDFISLTGLGQLVQSGLGAQRNALRGNTPEALQAKSCYFVVNEALRLTENFSDQGLGFIWAFSLKCEFGSD